MRILKPFLFALAATSLWSCLPQKEVDLKIPPHDRKLTVECFLEPGKPYRLVLTESVGFFDGPDTPFVDNALVIISHNGTSDTLQNGFSFDLQDLKLYNYSSTVVVPEDYNSDFTLYVRDPLGREIRGTTRMLQPVGFSSLVATFNEDSLASATAQWPDTPGERNYYMFTLHRDSLNVGEDSENGLQFSFTLDDRIGDGEDFTISTFFDFEVGEKVICTVYKLSEAYWRYIETANLSSDANGNPFANPVTIFSTVEDGFGVFTGMNYVRDTLIIQ